MAKRCVFCGKTLSFFDEKTLLCGNALQSVCSACWAGMQDMDQEERAHRAAAVAEEMHRAYLNDCVGQTYPVLFEQPKNGKFAGHAPNYMEVLAEGEETRVLHATQELVSLGLAKPILVGRPSVIEMRIQKLGLQIKAGVDFEIVNNESDPRFKEYWSEYYQLMKRRGITQEQAQRAVISNTTVIGAIMVHRGEADAMICGTIGEYHDHYRVVQPLFGYRDGVSTAGAMNALLLPSGNTFIADTYVNHDPSPEELAEITLMAAESVRRFGIEPRVALLSHSNFGSADCPSASKMRKTLELVKARAPELMIDGEMHGDAALVESIRNDRMPDSPLKGAANILVMPNMEAARISYNLLRVSSSEGVTVGPVLMGVAKPVHILTPIASVRRIVNMVALAVVEAQTEPL